MKYSYLKEDAVYLDNIYFVGSLPVARKGNISNLRKRVNILPHICYVTKAYLRMTF